MILYNLSEEEIVNLVFVLINHKDQQEIKYGQIK
nr:MAG TPA: hypothetical protein [Caudoviricetes sp.]